MKAISLWQPWASLWCSKRKVHETRHWRCSHRGWLLVHAAKRFETDLDDRLRAILDDEFGCDWTRDLPTGALIGMVNVVDCLPTQTFSGDTAANGDDRACGNFAPGRFAWKRDEFRLFDQPIPYRGAQGIFNVPEDVLLSRPRRLLPSAILLMTLAMVEIAVAHGGAAAETAPNVCGLSPTDWCHTPAAASCGRHPNEEACRADPRCAGLPYRGESVVACSPDGHGFWINCPAVGCISRSSGVARTR